MLSFELKQGNTYNFPILKEQSGGKFYRIKTDDDQEFNIQKFKFQLKQPLPDSIDCYVKSLYPLSLSQDIAKLISDYYKEDEEYSFIVKDINRDDSSQYEVKDDRGLCFKLNNSPVPLNKGTRIRCKVLRIKDAYVNLKYVSSWGSKYSLEFHSIEQWLRLLNRPESEARYFKRLLNFIPELQPAMIKFKNEVPGWTLDLLQLCTSNMTEWLVACKDDLPTLKKICKGLDLGKELALYMVQESDYLRSCSLEHRELLQGRISNYVELFEQYRQAAGMILDNKHAEYIDSMLRRLKNSGYLYMPSAQIRIMMTILKLRPELINGRMGELFDALHNWDITNWQTEPFRGALVQQLQLFIEENYGKVNILPASDSSSDNKIISRMIVAIAIQRLLANENDNIDLNLNRASLYRYISYLYPSEVNTLLDKSVCALLGIEGPNEFSWNDTENPTILFVKSSHPLNQEEDRSLTQKSYITSKTELHLTPDKIHLIGAGADPEDTVVPNNMFDWLNPVISLTDPITFPNTKKAKDLKSLHEVWDNIAWSLFGGKESEIDKIEKRLPEEGEETTVIIDDIRIIGVGNEKQRLQFHCTIHDEFLYGEGWMPCDAIHMIGWLTYKDIPGNYDGSLNFSLDSDGDPLLYQANVHYRADGSLEFSMKSQIEEYLLENTSHGKESIAIVTHFDKNNNKWLCLSESGATYKVSYDEASENLSIGMIVRVEYIEQDRSVVSPLFFIGELAKDQDNLPTSLKKSDFLMNLMQGIGVTSEKELPYQVMEAGQIMNKDELLELIFILQRRAFSESEYVKAFNYLGLASLLCRLADKKNLLREITFHMSLLEFLQEFSRNRKLDYDLVEAFEDQVKNSPMLERLYTRIKIVSDIDSNQITSWLWGIRQNPRNETEGKLASLVLSYNMLPKELEESRQQILNEISTLLNINSAISTSKYYGDESQTIEFKSSLIYTPNSGSRPDVKAQLFEITHIICGFMNARGGKLYIGVNDSGYENGLEDDLNYRRIRGEKATLDGMIVDLQNHLDRTLPTHAKDHWEIYSDPESKKGVIVVDIKPVRQPVELNGTIYVRASSTTKPRYNEEREEFIKSRNHNYNIIMALMGISDLEEPDGFPSDEDGVENKVDKEETKSSPAFETEDKEGSQKNHVLSTGKSRKHGLHDYDENFVTPEYYIYFNPDKTVLISHEDLYIDHKNNPEECSLALSVLDKEKDSDIIFTMSDSSILKMTLSDFGNMITEQNNEALKDKDIQIVNIASESDYLISVIRASNHSLFYRIDSIDKIGEGSNDKDKPISLINLPHKIVTQDVISGDKLSFFSNDAINREDSFYGVPVPIGDGTLSETEKIDALINPAIAD